mmetsp:Transcript_43494/g.94748  ORF Transcript_43494/g.94748 Transcript_43494/m.94748 type:complete len:460 (+) Transcript_43494:18-1397(+)|eukprot:CAMPEP_0204419888 /NCGR_PEP_ID=MMETSP0470-20130426/31114_1 /ASSEMBLY_ACC=CAM_ASM_000385 /TAXON_ID=2969 /ORGANISM="Oxyrrhis marina" /LENGTH=459 /DNA_ID=CAMNT_0051416757 /DNA_START=17 /DNA_END=1396 /DNA_ORIENTATION=+
MQRTQRLAAHVCSAPDLPPPPLAPIPDGRFFPTFPDMLEESRKHNGVFSYEAMGNRRITILAHPSLYDIIFELNYPGVISEKNKLGHAWFGIPLDIAKHNDASLAQVREAMAPNRADNLNEVVGRGIEQYFAKFPTSGTCDLWEITIGTFFPVNEAMFGDTFKDHPDALQLWLDFDKDFAKITAGYPRKMFPEHLAAQEKVVAIFKKALEDGKDRLPTCPVLSARTDGLPNKGADFSTETKARLMFSIFWAAQGNTLPMTYWMLAHILASPGIHERVLKEVRGVELGTGHGFNARESCPFTMACLYETLRMYNAVLAHRKVVEPVKVSSPSGAACVVPKGDMITMASYIQHRDPTVFPDPETFNPDRWLKEGDPTTTMNKLTAANLFFPFAKGLGSCSGKHLAMREIPTLVALFLRSFEAELVDPMPKPHWEEVLASVTPESFPFDTAVHTRVKFARRG